MKKQKVQTRVEGNVIYLGTEDKRSCMSLYNLDKMIEGVIMDGIDKHYFSSFEHFLSHLINQAKLANKARSKVA